MVGSLLRPVTKLWALREVGDRIWIALPRILFPWGRNRSWVSVPPGPDQKVLVSRIAPYGRSVLAGVRDRDRVRELAKRLGPFGKRVRKEILSPFSWEVPGIVAWTGLPRLPSPRFQSSLFMVLEKKLQVGVVGEKTYLPDPLSRGFGLVVVGTGGRLPPSDLVSERLRELALWAYMANLSWTWAPQLRRDLSESVSEWGQERIDWEELLARTKELLESSYRYQLQGTLVGVGEGDRRR